MDITRFETGPRMSQAVVHNGTVYLAGQVGNAGDDVATQTAQALASVDRLLEQAGTDKTRILNATIWLADMVDFPKMNAVWDKWAPQGNTPARATGEAKLATPDYLVEVIVIAAL
ncbi:enamine deaminase RidA (YjgF/YER057c/UK114 family) [Rhizobium sp. PP-F2F-G48]|uniref:RidA family protein n=1 Tax=Rhizobium sp. PP-F2F-G48 TaxID=2135651 RepID=UPI001051DB12|nr:RidA family protein [Rhizobium sp. PP-F2F-G48]TCM55945.1 enamine deaminase RidA (YjgF/YER057c/UK114 family) [Rhizobium sp. PP-F2F-G48]